MSHSKYRRCENEDLNEPYPWHYHRLDEDHSYRHNLVTLPDIELTDANHDKQAYHLVLRVGNYQPSGITLKQQDRTLIVQCQHVERSVAGCWETCRIVRRLQIPEEAEMNRAYAWMSKNGTLSILAPISMKANEHRIPIKFESRIAVAPSAAVARDLRQRRMQEAQYRMEAALRFQSTRNNYAAWSSAPLQSEAALRNASPQVYQVRQCGDLQRRLYNYVPYHKVAIPLPYPRSAGAIPVANNSSFVVICSTDQQEGDA